MKTSYVPVSFPKVDWAKAMFNKAKYKVIYTDDATKAQILSHLRSTHIYAYFYVGHGDVNTGSMDTADDGTVAAAKITPYHIPAMYILSCGSYTGVAGWKQNVSLYGTLETYDGCIYGPVNSGKTTHGE